MHFVPGGTPTIHVRYGDHNTLTFDIVGILRCDDHDARGALEEKLNLHADLGRTRLILNMTRGWMDSRTLGVLITTWKKLRGVERATDPPVPATDPNADLKLVVDPAGAFARLLHQAKLDEIFEVFSTESEAVLSFENLPRPVRR